ncbi:MAG: TolB family protein, partial [Acidimicrobiales bacterium]
MDSHNLHTGARHPDELRRAAKDRGRQLRRRRTVAVRAVMALTVVAGAGVVVALVAFGPRSSVPAVTPTSRPASTAGPATKPTVDTAAFAGEGRLAFVCGGELYVLDGTTGALVRVTDGSALPSSPAFSPDGRWLAFVRPAPGSGDGPETLWLAHGDGTGAHAVAGLPSADPPPDSGTPVFSWSPTADQLVVTTGPTAAGTGSVPSAVWIVSGSGAANRLL